ncbi:hypothetical protein ACFFK0_00685 [Paenibacillus chartarius]|uniref:Uncharacterized protein n=1 Tax=Paenibacillus chartarius TaxID=747481 RepID=A0ABV6DEA0_9BACL
MNKNDEQQFLLTMVQRAEADSVIVRIQPQIIIVVRIREDSRRNVSAKVMQTIECVYEVTDERFEITLLSDAIADGGGQRKFKFFQRFIEKLCGGWRVQFFQSFGSTTSLMIDRVRRMLLINADVLRMPYRSLMKLIGRLPEMIGIALKSVKSTVDGFTVPQSVKSQSASDNAYIVLVASEKGLLFPPDFILTASEWTMRVTATDTELCISASRRRWIHRGLWLHCPSMLIRLPQR